MISIVIPTLNAQEHLPACLGALIPAVVEGLVREVIIADGGSSDLTAQIAEDTGATFIKVNAGRGTQMAAGARIAKSDWLLFLHADTVLETGWERETRAFIVQAERVEQPVAAAFRFALDDTGFKPRLLERLVAFRSRFLGVPYGDQGLLINSRLYEQVGGFRDLGLMEDIDLVHRLNRNQMNLMRSKAVTSAARFKRDGYVKRSGRNLICLALYYLNVESKTIERFYD